MEEPKRQTQRVKPSRVLVRIATAEALRAHYLKDLSEGGLFLRVEKPLPLGSEVLLELIPPGWDSALPLTGTVVRVADDDQARAAGAMGMALKFENLEPEVEQRLAALVAEYAGPSKVPGAGTFTEADRLKTQIQGLVFELGAAREAQQSAETSLSDERGALVQAREKAEELAARCEALTAELAVRESQPAAPSPAMAAELEIAQGEILSLRAELEDSQAQVRAVKHDLETIEQDEANSRALSESLANEKAALEQLHHDETERAAGELSRLQSELSLSAKTQEAAQAKLKELERALAAEKAARKASDDGAAGEKRARAAAEGRAEALQKKLTEVSSAQADTTAHEAKLRAAAQQLAKAEQRLADSNAQLERAKAKERDLRRLLSLVSPKQGADAVVVIEEDAEEAPPAAAPRPIQLVQPLPEQPAPEEPPLPEPAAPSGDLVEQLFGAEPEAQDGAPPDDAGAGWDAAPAAGDPNPLAEGGWDTAIPVEGQAAWTDLPAEGSVVFEAVPGEVAASELAPSEIDVSVQDQDGDLPEITGETIDIPEELPAAPAATPMPEDWAFLDLSEVPGVLPQAEPEPLPFEAPGDAVPEPRLDAADFDKRLRGGGRVVRTEKFHLHTSTDQAEVMVNAWLEEGDTLLALVRLAKGRLTADRIARVLFGHYGRGLVELSAV
ncbi:MAG: PilZ domain-containing protein [Myxococcaceae bacterium]